MSRRVLCGSPTVAPVNETTVASYRARWELGDASGAHVAIDVIRAFTTAAYAFAAGAGRIVLADTLDTALRFGAEYDAVVMGEEHGRKPDGFDYSNSPVLIAATDLDGRTVVQRTSAGTQGAYAARSASALWCASLVCASATADALRTDGSASPTYVITGRFPDRPEISGDDDLLTAQYIEALRTGAPADADALAAAVSATDEATRTLALGGSDSHPDDIAYATDVDRFDFAMRVSWEDARPVLRVER